MSKVKTRQQLIDEGWIFSYKFKNGLEVWCHTPRYEDIIQFIRWNPKTEEFLGLETVPYNILCMYKSIFNSLEDYEF